MGSACCIAARDRIASDQARAGTSRKKSIYSKSWMFGWRKTQMRIADNRNYPARHELPFYDVRDEPWSSSSEEVSFNVNQLVPEPVEDSPLFALSIALEQATSYYESPEIAYALSQNLSFTPSSTLITPFADNLSSQTDPPPKSTPSQTLSFSPSSVLTTPIADNLSSQTNPPPNSTPSGQARFSPEHHLFRQVSGSTVSGLKSPTNNSVSEGRPSFVLSTFSNELADGSVGASFDQWSLNTFTALVASSQRERWSFDGSPYEFGHSKFSRCSSGLSYSSPGAMNVQTCGVCLKFLTERSSWRAQDCPVIAVLVCGHVYHSDCLEMMTSAGWEKDPACPCCILGKNQSFKFSANVPRVGRRSEIFRNQVVDSSVDGSSDVEAAVCEMEMCPSSSKQPANAKGFFRHHFTFGTKRNRSMSQKGSSAKEKGV